MATNWTTMTVKQETYEKVKAMKEGGDSFSDVLERLCENYGQA